MPGGNKNIRPEDGKQFSSEYQPANRGRKPKLYTQFNVQGYSKEQVREAISVVSAMTMGQLIEITDNDDADALLLTVARAFMGAASEGKYRDVKDMIELFADKARQDLDVTSGGGTITFTPIPKIQEEE